MTLPRPRLPRRTARLRLTVLYGGVFGLGAAVLLTVTYLLVSQLTAPRIHSNGTPPGKTMSPGAGLRSAPVTQQQFRTNLDVSKAEQALQTHAHDMEILVIFSGIALAIALVAAVVIAWLIAGRVLRPLSTITAAARRISASNLHQRLSLSGPDDELRELGDTLDDLLGRLEASFDAQRRFVANASHELRTPLTRERTLLQVTRAKPTRTLDTWETVSEELLASNAEQERLIEALLTLAASQAGLEHRERVDLAAVTSAVLCASRSDAADLGLHVETVIQPAVLHGDPVLAGRLAANLIDNAIRHNIAGGHIQVTTRTRDGRAVLSVTSTGPVVPPGLVDGLFEPFHRLRPRGTGNGHGFGLGLSIVQAIAAAHDAEITAQARPGGGLAIDVAFPPPAPVTRAGGEMGRKSPDLRLRAGISE